MPEITREHWPPWAREEYSFSEYREKARRDHLDEINKEAQRLFDSEVTRRGRKLEFLKHLCTQSKAGEVIIMEKMNDFRHITREAVAASTMKDYIKERLLAPAASKDSLEWWQYHDLIRPNGDIIENKVYSEFSSDGGLNDYVGMTNKTIEKHLKEPHYFSTLIIVWVYNKYTDVMKVYRIYNITERERIEARM